MIDWDFISPTLGVASGICSIDDINHFRGINDQIINILKFKIKVERGSLGFTGLEKNTGIPSKLFDMFRERVAQMAYSYHRGMMLSNGDFFWYHDETDIDLEELQKEEKNYMHIKTSQGGNSFIYKEPNKKSKKKKNQKKK